MIYLAERRLPHLSQFLMAVSVLIAISGCSPKAAPPPVVRTQADLVLQHGAVYTVDAERSWAEAIAIKDGRIVFRGLDRDVTAFVGDGTRVIDLKGRMVLPGFQDSHVHPISGGMEATACNLNGKKGADEYVATIAAYAAANPDMPWILGGGWSMAAFGPGGKPSRALLDKIVPDRPVFLSSSDGHTTWVNSKALEIAGITRETPDPPDGHIDRDAQTGEAIGSLQEGAGQLVGRHVPAANAAQREDGLRYSIKMLNGYGITAIQDAGTGEEALQTYAALDKAAQLTLRVTAAQWWERSQGLEQIEVMKARRDRYTHGRLRATSVKIMQDGVMENYTAVMLEPYLIPGEVRGIPMVDPELLKKAVATLDAEGFQVHFHAIGDGAIRQCLNAVQFARESNGALGHRHHISHLQLIDKADIPRFRELDVIANFQPQWAYADDYIIDLTTPFIGEQRSQQMYAIASVVRSGAMVAFGSDWSVSTANPMVEMEVAVLRADPDLPAGEVFVPDERIDLPTALAAFTINAAYTNGIEQQTGSIEVGKFADLVVLDQNLFAIDAHAISDTKVVLTLLEGKAVHGDLESL